MRFATKVVLLLVIGSVAPVAASGIISAKLSSDALRRETGVQQAALADQTAAHLGSWFSGVTNDLRRATQYLPLASATRDELGTLLRLPFRQLDYVTALALIDSSGKAVVPPVYLVKGTGAVPEDLRDRPRLGPAEIQRLSRHVPLALALKAGVAFGPAYSAGARGGRLVCAVRLTPDAPATRPSALPGASSSAAPWVLAAEISLDGARRVLRSAGPGRAWLVDGTGRVVVASLEGAWARLGADLSHLPPLKGGAGLAYRSPDGELVLGTARPVTALGFAVLLEQPAHAALGTARQLWLYTILWALVCLALAVGGGVVLGRGVTQPVQDLAAAAARIQAGDYSATVPVGAPGRGDELAQLGRAFNEMSAAVERSMRVIQTQKDELQTWNEELHQRVEERTREVQEAIQQVVRSQKLGALAELGAGLAHELNNPLTGIMGLAQLGLLDLPADHALRDPLQQIVDQCKRMRDIVRNLQRFSQTPENVEHAPVDIAMLCGSVITLAGSAIEEGKVVVERSFPPDLPHVVGNADELRQMLLHLVHNAVRAMPSGGKLVLSGREVEEAVRLTVADTGKGIPAAHLERIFEPFFAADKTETHRPGLGLSVAHRIVSEHHGKITVRSKPGEGTEFAVVLPGRRQELHLK